jgi:hypothetical protein
MVVSCDHFSPSISVHIVDSPFPLSIDRHGPGWDPNSSSLLQILISIQALILVAEPFFNEPGYDGLRGTQEGEEASMSYNATIREATLNEAIFKQMLYPSCLISYL